MITHLSARPLSQISSALLTWSIVILVPLILVIAAAAMPIAELLNPANANAHCDRAEVIDATGHMLVVFSPQVVLYGLSVVLYGLLQAYRRFTGPTLGPAVASLVVIASCLAFVPLSGGLPLSRLPLSAELVLSLGATLGATLGVAALVVVGIVPTRRLDLRLRPAWRFPPGVARRAGGLALVGVVELVIIDLASVVTITLANGRGSTGAIVIFNYASQVFNCDGRPRRAGRVRQAQQVAVLVPVGQDAELARLTNPRAELVAACCRTMRKR